MTFNVNELRKIIGLHNAWRFINDAIRSTLALRKNNPNAECAIPEYFSQLLTMWQRLYVYGFETITQLFKVSTVKLCGRY